jgi:membrane-associated phospholipid phosphatase
MLQRSALIFLLLISVLFKGQSFDLNLLTTINERDRPVWDNGMRYTSISIFPVVIVTPVFIWSHGQKTKNEKLISNGLKSAVSMGSALVVSVGLKYLVSRPRPYVTYEDNIIRRDTAGPHSFPSGHTTAAFATATALSLSYNKWYVTVPSFLYSGLVGYSRMRLGVHYPSDVLGGIVIGVGSGLLTWKIDKMIKEKKAREKTAPEIE